MIGLFLRVKKHLFFESVWKPALAGMKIKDASGIPVH